MFAHSCDDLLRTSFIAAGESLEDALRQLFVIDVIGLDGKITALGKRVAGTLRTKIVVLSIYWLGWC